MTAMIGDTGADYFLLSLKRQKVIMFLLSITHTGLQNVIIYMKKFLDSDWLRGVQF